MCVLPAWQRNKAVVHGGWGSAGELARHAEERRFGRRGAELPAPTPCLRVCADLGTALCRLSASECVLTGAPHTFVQRRLLTLALCGAWQLAAVAHAAVWRKHFKHGGKGDMHGIAASHNRPMIRIGG